MYQLYSKSNIKLDNILDKVLENRGIDNKEKLLKPSEDDVIHYSKLKNINKAIALVDKHIKNNSEIVIVVDCDIDGNSSAAILVAYINKNFPSITIHILFHEGKQHGLTDPIMRQIKELDNVELLIVPDASSNDYEQHEELSKLGLEILVLDHHESEKESEFALVVNNQLSPEYSNKELSGVGIVYKTLQALDDFYGLTDADNYLDLVAIGNVADAMDLTEPETRHLVYKGLRQIKNEFLIEMIKKNFGQVDEIHPHGLSFQVLPKNNAIIRVGSQDEKLDMFRAFCDDKEISERTYRGKTTIETLAQKVTRLATNAHQRQKKLREKWVKILTKQINDKGLDSNAFIIINVEEKFDRELTGYLASGLVNVYKKPVLLMAWNEEKDSYTGSLRGYDRVLKDTKSFLNELNLFNFVSGHGQAAGFSIDGEKLDVLDEKINQKLDFTNNTEPLLVDFILSEKDVAVSLIKEVSALDKYWGKGIEQPTFVVVNAEIDTSKLSVSSKSKMTKWFKNGIEFIQFNGDDNLIQYEGENKILKADLIGKMSVNKFMGKTTNQFIIDSIEILEVNNKGKTGFDVSNLF